LWMRVPGLVQFKYMMIAGGLGIVVGVIGGLLLSHKEAQEAY